MTVIFLLFLFSGFCGLLYQIVWIRMAFAAYGVITPVLSVVISVFMLGLGLGSWMGGRWIELITAKPSRSAIWYYGLTELFIGVGGLVVPFIFSAGERLLLPLGDMDSFRYLFLSAVILAFSILPWCFFMGTTFPFMMAFVKATYSSPDTSFSYLYLANVIGAMCGAMLTACVLIELLGFHQTLLVAAGVNFTIALVSFALGFARSEGRIPGEANTALFTPSVTVRNPEPERGFLLLAILFMTGFVSMGMEVIWTRAFTPLLSTTIYAFSSLLAVYLFATWIGSLMYRRHVRKHRAMDLEILLLAVAGFSAFPIMFTDPRLPMPLLSKILLSLISIFPFSAILGYLTPSLIDRYSRGGPREAGMAYAINIFGCIFGPILASYILLPALGVRLSIIMLALFLALFIPIAFQSSTWSRGRQVLAGLVVIVLFAYTAGIARSYEESDNVSGSVVRRDYAATVISSGQGMGKKLLVNGIGMTVLVPITKVMAHLPLAFLSHHPESGMVICFGMGTTYRSMMSWGIDTTAVELIPGVRDAFGYYFDDAGEILKRPNGQIVIDDGRRYLKRTSTKFDVITIDPPPPVEAAGSSLLYSREFYELVKTRLKVGGILQQWFPGGEGAIIIAAARSLREAFPHIRVFVSIAGWGFHFLASSKPLPVPGPDEFVDRLPERAWMDLVEWSNSKEPRSTVQDILSKEIPLSMIIDDRISIPCITDDRPYNEYFLLRRLWALLPG